MSPCEVCAQITDGGWGPNLPPGHTHCADSRSARVVGCHRTFTRSQHHCVVCHSTFRSDGAARLHCKGETCQGDPGNRRTRDGDRLLKAAETEHGLVWSSAKSVDPAVFGRVAS